jgi:hypothetical protein
MYKARPDPYPYEDQTSESNSEGTDRGRRDRNFSNFHD